MRYLISKSARAVLEPWPQVPLIPDEPIHAEQHRAQRAVDETAGALEVVSNANMSGSGRFLDLSCTLSMSHDVCDAYRSITDF